MSPSRHILVISHRLDAHARAVSWALKSLNIAHTCWDFEEYPRANQISWRINETAEKLNLLQSQVAVVDHFDTVWLRRARYPKLSPLTHPDDSKIIQQELNAFFKGIIPSIGDTKTFWVNKYGHDDRGEDKLFQLKTAKKIGLSIPNTLISSIPSEIQEFFDENEKNNKRTIHKCFYPGKWDINNGGELIIKTSVLERRHLLDDDVLALCPAIYQEYIDKEYEIRVTVMGQQLVAVRIDSQATSAAVDWRYDTPTIGLPPIQPIDLPESIKEQCLKLCSEMGLVFACIDLIYSKTGQYVFLELNQAGNFLWKEELLPNLGLLDRFCQFLINPECKAYEPDTRISYQLFKQTDEFQLLIRELDQIADASQN